MIKMTIHHGEEVQQRDLPCDFLSLRMSLYQMNLMLAPNEVSIRSILTGTKTVFAINAGRHHISPEIMGYVRLDHLGDLPEIHIKLRPDLIELYIQNHASTSSLRISDTLTGMIFDAITAPPASSTFTCKSTL